MTDLRPAPKPKVIRDEEFLDFIRGMACVCGCDRPGEPHHVRPRRMWGEANNVVPMAHACHMEGHTIGWDTWQERKQIWLKPLAEFLWRLWTEAKARGKHEDMAL